MNTAHNSEPEFAAELTDDDFITPRDVHFDDVDDDSFNDDSFNDAITSLSKCHRLGDRSEQQRVLYALIAHTLAEYRSDVLSLLVAMLLLMPLCGLIGVILGFGATAGCGWLLAKLGLSKVLVVLLAVLAFLFAKAFKQLHYEQKTSLNHSDGGISAFSIGRLEAIFSVAAPAMPILFLGAFLGIQTGILMFTSGHLGLPIEGTFVECCLLTLDNACHGLFFDSFELYDMYWGTKLEHDTYSASVFLAFRLSFEAMALMFGYSVWNRYRMRHLFHDFPQEERDVNGVLKWIERSCSNKELWPNRYHDEFLLLLMAKEFINGDFDFVRKLSRELKAIQVDQEVRDLFQQPNGVCAFHSAPPE